MVAVEEGGDLLSDERRHSKDWEHYNTKNARTQPGSGERNGEGLFERAQGWLASSPFSTPRADWVIGGGLDLDQTLFLAIGNGGGAADGGDERAPWNSAARSCTRFVFYTQTHFGRCSPHECRDGVACLRTV